MFRIIRYHEVLTPLFVALKRKVSRFIEDILNHNFSDSDDFWPLDADLKDVDKQYVIRRHLDDL